MNPLLTSALEIAAIGIPVFPGRITRESKRRATSKRIIHGQMGDDGAAQTILSVLRVTGRNGRAQLSELHLARQWLTATELLGFDLDGERN
jgi:hypothetical protein